MFLLSFYKVYKATKGITTYLDGVTGEYATPKGYFVCDENPEGFAAYEATFSYKEKLKLPGQLI